MEITLEILNKFNELHDEVYSSLEELTDDVYNEIYYWYNSIQEAESFADNILWNN